MASEEQRARRGERFLGLADVRSSAAGENEAAKLLGDAATTLLEGSPEGVAIIDRSGCIVYWNQPDGHVWELLTVSYARRPPA